MKPYQNNVIYFAKTDYPRDKRVFGIYQKDKVFHTLITGQTGTGKTSLLETKILQEIQQNLASVIVFDPHGDLIQNIIVQFPEHRKKDLVVIDPSDQNSMYGYNPLKKVNEEHKPLVVSNVLEIFKRLYHDSWGLRLENILRQSLYLLLEQNKASLADIPKLLVDQKFRQRCLYNTRKAEIIDFWTDEFPKYRADALLVAISKSSSSIHHPAVKRTIIEPTYDLSLRKVIDAKKIVLISLPKGKLGNDISSLIGSMLLTSLALAAYSRADSPSYARPYCSLYIDEFQNYTNTSLIAMFSELRKYNMGITIATQYLASLRSDIRDSILGNVANLITFRVSIDQARLLSRYLYPVFTPEQLASLPNHTICLVMMINGKLSVPFWARTIQYKNIYREQLNNQF